MKHTLSEWNAGAFGRVTRRLQSTKRTLEGINADPGYASPLPEEVGFQLTNRCNLRCAQCFQWAEFGHYRTLPILEQKQDLSISIIERVLAETRPAQSDVYLWGGEPLIYREWDTLVGLLEADPRWTTVCTNGLAVESKLDSLTNISAQLAMLISVDGFEAEHDELRGAGTFKKIMSGIDALLEAKRAGTFKGEVSVCCVVSPPMVSRLFEFARFFETKGVNTVYFNLPWYIPQDTADRMDQYFDHHFGWLAAGQPNPSQSRNWHSYQYRLEPELVPALSEQVERISKTSWAIRVRFQPHVEPDEIEDFLRGSERPVQNRTRCLSIATRLNVLPSGAVTTCKLFPEFAVGNLHNNSVEEVWAGVTARRARAILSRGLTPVCSKCVQLYLHGA